MDINEIVNIISSLGFPIFISLFFIKYSEEKDAKHDEQQNQLIQQFFNYIKDDQKKATEAMNELKEAIIELKEGLKRKDEKDNDI